MFSRLLKGPDAEKLTLEIIGLATGARSFGTTGLPWQTASSRAARYASDARKVLKRDGETLDQDQRRFLEKAERGLTELSKTPDNIGTGNVTFPGEAAGLPIELHQTNPEWLRQTEKFRRSLAVEAGEIFDRKFSNAAVEAVISATDGAEAKLRKTDPMVALRKAL
jgi:hypothetical protein